MVLQPDIRKVVVITDATSGIGPVMVRNLCTTLRAVVYITCSSKKEGEELMQTFTEEGISPVLRVVDLASEGQINDFAKELKELHGGVDALITNCKKQLPKSTSLYLDDAENLITMNYFNVVRLLKTFLPIVKAHGRVVLCTSHPGVHYGREFLRDAPGEQTAAFRGGDVTLERVESGMASYLESVASGAPWTPQVDIVSTMGLYALVQMVTKKLAVEQDLRSLLINVASVGWALTPEGRTYLDEKGNHRGEPGIEPEVAAADVLWLAKLPRGTKGPNALLMKNRAPVKWKQYQ